MPCIVVLFGGSFGADRAACELKGAKPLLQIRNVHSQSFVCSILDVDFFYILVIPNASPSFLLEFFLEDL